jgi:ABC-2 type transport system permease protein
MNAANQGWLVARREMRERARSRGFRISVLLMLLVVVAMVVLPGLLDTAQTTKNVGITGATSQVVEQALSNEGDSGYAALHLRRFDTAAAGEKALRDQDIDVLVVGERRLEWREKADPELQALIAGAIQVSTVLERAAAAGMDPNTAAQLLAPVPVESVSIGAVPGRSADDAAAAALMTVALLAAIVIYGNLVLTGVVEEKSSRVVEVLLARVPAKSLLGGKVVGIGLLGFAQLAVTALAALITSMFVDSADLPAVSAGVLAWVLVWFVLGYALYAMIYGALGSLASRTEDAQAVAGPVGYVLVAGYWLSFMALSADPDGMWARLLSVFPATAPLAMPGRIALGATAWWESPIAVVLTLAAIAGLVSFAGRVYQNAVLRTGAVIRLRDAWHKHTEEPQPPLTPPLAPPTQKVTNMLTLQRKSSRWPLVLSTAGVLVAVVILTVTSDVVASLIALLVTFVAVRALVQHQQRGHETPRAPRSG